ncbi:unnamed protein product [Amoebophrya sp. A120]|nr:unnamed protein product [Amoebophrya sp. A120]|eukprot:GSA120T00021251001.1
MCYGQILLVLTAMMTTLCRLFAAGRIHILMKTLAEARFSLLPRLLSADKEPDTSDPPLQLRARSWGYYSFFEF